MSVMVKKLGRPKKAQAEQRTNVLRICLSPSERRAIDGAAQADHLDTSAWARAAILRAAEKIMNSVASTNGGPIE